MANTINTVFLDLGLGLLANTANNITICSQDPTTYTEATSTYALGSRPFSTGAAGVFSGATSAGSPNGRKVTSQAVTNGNVTATGTATRWAVVDSGNTRLCVNGSLSASQSVTLGNSFTLTSFDVTLPNQ